MLRINAYKITSSIRWQKQKPVRLLQDLEQPQKQQDQEFILKRKILHTKEVRIIVRRTEVKENNLEKV
jgi:hypothetical protein